MSIESRRALLILNSISAAGPLALNRLLEAYGGDPVAALSADRGRLQAAGIDPAWIGDPAHRIDLEKEESRIAQSGADFVIRSDRGYPAYLKQIADPPLGFYRKGTYDFRLPSIAIVGSRRATLYGQAMAKRFAADLGRRGFCIVSGLARGIDTAAHEGALSVGGKTVAVLGTGIDVVFPPENLALYRQIEQTGALMSEFPFGRQADLHSLPMRSRLISGICQAVLVVESDVSGGAMITARFAGEQGRTLFAIPGRIDQSTSSGCNQLIRDGAVLVTRVEEILSELNVG
jgi:DNA processing protein